MMLRGLAGLDYSTHLDLTLNVHKKMGNVWESGLFLKIFKNMLYRNTDD